MYTVEPPKKGHFGTRTFGPCREVGLCRDCMLQYILWNDKGCGFKFGRSQRQLLRKSNIPEPGRWPLAGVWRLPLPLFRGSKCVKSMLKSIRTLRFGRCREVGRCWEAPLTEVPLYIHPMFVFHFFIVNRLLFYLLLSQVPFSSLLTLFFCFFFSGKTFTLATCSYAQYCIKLP